MQAGSGGIKVSKPSEILPAVTLNERLVNLQYILTILIPKKEVIGVLPNVENSYRTCDHIASSDSEGCFY